MTEITPHQLSTWLFDDKKELFLLDVREPYERDICDIGGTLIPLMQLPEHIAEIPKNVSVVIYCKSGRRSKKAAELLQQQGYQEVYSLQGGILQWISDIDTSLSKY